MKTIKEENTLLASLAVFRELYNSENDVYGIISIFLNELISSRCLYSFSLNEITNQLNSTYEFEIPEAVVRTSLSRLKFIAKEKTNYIVTDVAQIKSPLIDLKQQSIITGNKDIIDRLYLFIAKKLHELSDSEKERIAHSFCCFLLDQANGDEYIEFITAYILENEHDTDFKNQLNLIREGVVLYSGIKYNNNLNDLGTWRTEMTIYMETEILFHLAGYNGELYQNLVLDFLNFVRDINVKAQKKLIKLKYFVEVKDEIERFFTKAKYLIEGNERPKPNITAMVSIVNGCKAPSDILEKKTDFYLLLKGWAIEEDTYKDYFSPYNHKYNVVSKEIIERVSTEIEKDAEPYLSFLNYISIHRKEASENNFENIGHILLTANSSTLKVAWHDLLKEDGNVPLATHLSFLTNKFWFKLNKGFGKNTMPKSFDVITKAQVILSGVLNDAVGEKFEELKSQYKSGKLSAEQAKSRIVDLRNQVRKPEEIKNDIVQDVLAAITEDSLEKFIQEQSHLKIKAEKHEEENLKLLGELEAKKNVEIELFAAKQQILNDRKHLKSTLEKQKQRLDTKANDKYKRLKLAIIIAICAYYVLLVSAIFYFTWNVMEQYTFILSLVPIIVSLLYLIMTEKTINPFGYLESKKEKYVKQIYADFDFDIAALHQVESEVSKLTTELKQQEVLAD